MRATKARRSRSELPLGITLIRQGQGTFFYASVSWISYENDNPVAIGWDSFGFRSRATFKYPRDDDDPDTGGTGPTDGNTTARLADEDADGVRDARHLIARERRYGDGTRRRTDRRVLTRALNGNIAMIAHVLPTPAGIHQCRNLRRGGT